MAGYSYFHYDQMTLLEVEVHSEQLELLKNAADEYDWNRIESEIKPLFKEAALDFRNKRRQMACPHKQQAEEDLQETFPFLDEIEETDVISNSRNSRGAGRKGQDFISYLKAFELAPVLRVEQNSEAIAAEIAGNPAFYVACSFTSHPAARTLRDFDQIMCEYGLWDLVHDVAYRKNVEDKVIDEKAEDTLNIDNTHLLGYSTPGKYVKECRECELFEDCEDKVSTDETADWYIKGKYKCYYAHQIGMSQLASSGAPVGCVVLNGKQYEPDSLEPLLVDVKENHPDLSNIDKVNTDGIFNSHPCRDTVREILGKDAELFASVNPRNKKDIENPARGIAKITKHGNVQCIAGHNMVFLSKDHNMDAYIFGCPVLNGEARRKLEHMGLQIPNQCECEKKEECSPNSEIGRIYRVKREMLSQIDWDNPQFSYRFKLVYSLRTKIERLFSRMKERFKMAHVYKRGIDKIRGHILKFMNLMHILANLTGTYGV
jgi:hypothetical protein